MADLQVWQIAASLASGGAAGAVLTSIVSSYKNRIQPVGYRTEIIPLFRPASNPGSLEAKVMVKYDDCNCEYENLFFVELQVVNRGNQDLVEFPFGVTLRSGDEIVHAEGATPDRHHQIKESTAVSPLRPGSNIDFLVSPFNRGDSYHFRLYVSTRNNAKELGPVKLGSPAPVRFVAMPTTAEIVQAAARETLLNVGKFTLSIR
jgi:hypothetical protein